jgi:hypothetical protein
MADSFDLRSLMDGSLEDLDLILKTRKQSLTGFIDTNKNTLLHLSLIKEKQGFVEIIISHV